MPKRRVGGMRSAAQKAAQLKAAKVSARKRRTNAERIASITHKQNVNRELGNSFLQIKADTGGKAFDAAMKLHKENKRLESMKTMSPMTKKQSKKK